MGVEAEYLIVAGVVWLRRSTEAGWAVTFDDMRVRQGRGAWLLERGRAAGELDGLSWELELEELAPAFRSPRPVLRPVASSVDADPASFVRLTYRDTDGSEVHFYHSPRARLNGPDLAVGDAAYEIASRERMPELEPT